MKMQLFAVERSVVFEATLRAKSNFGSTTSANHDATRPVPAICMKRRRLKPGPRARPVPRAQSGHSLFFFIASLAVASHRNPGRQQAAALLVEQKLQTVDQSELQVLGLLLQVPAL